MSRIIFQKSYIVVVPSFEKTDMHKHPFMHLFLGKTGCKITADKKDIQGNMILLGSNAEHVVKKGNGCNIFLLIDPTCAVAKRLRDQFLQDCSYCYITDRDVYIPENIKDLSDKEIIQAVENVLSAIGIFTEETCTKDERIEQVISNVISGRWLSYSVKQIAEAVCLSESRLTHLFKEEAGISLKSYILIRRMERAYRFVSAGGKVTQAAMESGFASSAHLAYTCKSLTGISITNVLKNTEK